MTRLLRHSKSFNPQDNFPKLLTLFEPFVSFPSLRKRHHRINHRLYESALDKIKHWVKLRFATHIRAEN